MPEITFRRTAARAVAYGHVIIVRESPQGPKAWGWQLFPIGGAPGERDHGSSSSEGGARTAAKKALLSIPAVADQVKRENTLHWNGEPMKIQVSTSNYPGAARACGAKEGPSTNDLRIALTCAACTILASTKPAPPPAPTVG